MPNPISVAFNKWRFVNIGSANFPGLCSCSLVKKCIVCIIGDSGFFRHQGIVKATVFGIVEDLKFKISEGSDQN